VGTKGPGETQIETDRRAIHARISHLKEKLADINKERDVQRKGRTALPRIAMVGYTNAGKSTLLKLLTGADVLIEDRLFATLDTTVRHVDGGPGLNFLISDTVGFIRKLPAHLIATFRSTLAEVVEADILLHVVDVAHPQFAEHVAVVNDTLDKLNASGKPTIHVFNKIDKLADRDSIHDIERQYDAAVFISAKRGINVPSLMGAVRNILQEDVVDQSITVSQSDYGTIAKLHEFAEILNQTYEGNTVQVRFRIRRGNQERLLKLLGSGGRPTAKPPVN
jgi:GTP-binding protein HflX